MDTPASNYRVKSGFVSLIAVSAVIYSLASPTVSAASPPAPENYATEYFEARDPSNALQMVQFIPNADSVLSGGGGGRGLGGRSERLLINGKRITGKSTGAQTVLEQMPPDSVETIEVYRNGAEHLGLTGSNMVVNVVLKPGSSALTGRWATEAILKNRGIMAPNASVNLNYRNGSRLVTLGAEIFERKTEFQKVRTRDSIEEVEVYNADRTGDYTRDGLNFSFGYNDQLFSDVAMSLNGLLKFQDEKVIRDEAFTEVVDEALVQSNEDQMRDQKLTAYELSANLDGELSSSTSLTLTMLQSYNDRWENEDREEVADNLPVAATRSAEDRERGESVVRATLNSPFLDGWSVRYGAEGAYNYLQKDQEEFTGDNLEELEIIDIDNASAEVDEMRGEVFANLSKSVSDDTRLEVSSIYEFSKIRQKGEDVAQSRQLAFFKPRIALTHDLNASEKVNVDFGRNVGQLNFDEFITSVDLDEGKVEAGNPDLSPTKNWRLALVYEKQLAESAGRIRVKAFHLWMDDAIGDVPFGDTSVTGNIGKAKRFGVELKSSFIWRGEDETKLDFRVLAQDSTIIDPFLNEKRLMSGFAKYHLSASLDRSFQEWGGRIGGSLNWSSKRYWFDYNETGHWGGEAPSLNLFVEKKLSDVVRLSVSANNILSPATGSEKIRYADSRLLGTVDYFETEYNPQDPSFTISLSGQF
ncbi:hypothetical protein GCM10017044_18200 [Kordiimonas sediminis]|uniref:TonB-dependent receptor plug domain-containing protein n=1 Tax=Kordiimonas sediminis TaxID=1735581 RepID=A0A919E857_9PROT|nr:TonB-dependent receptor [Kordiimonas sediminis]GHF23986.1 hypothetical protein GCM10017044_18200 [Kordiimonas sediminis]